MCMTSGVHRYIYQLPTNLQDQAIYCAGAPASTCKFGLLLSRRLISSPQPEITLRVL